jgi:hypothetical protein
LRRQLWQIPSIAGPVIAAGNFDANAIPIAFAPAATFFDAAAENDTAITEPLYTLPKL